MILYVFTFLKHIYQCASARKQELIAQVQYLFCSSVVCVCVHKLVCSCICIDSSCLHKHTLTTNNKPGLLVREDAKGRKNEFLAFLNIYTPPVL